MRRYLQRFFQWGERVYLDRVVAAAYLLLLAYFFGYLFRPLSQSYGIVLGLVLAAAAQGPVRWATSLKWLGAGLAGFLALDVGQSLNLGNQRVGPLLLGLLAAGAARWQAERRLERHSDERAEKEKADMLARIEVAEQVILERLDRLERDLTPTPERNGQRRVRFWQR